MTKKLIFQVFLHQFLHSHGIFNAHLAKTIDFSKKLQQKAKFVLFCLVANQKSKISLKMPPVCYFSGVEKGVNLKCSDFKDYGALKVIPTAQMKK